MIYSDPIIDELHDIREKMVQESKDLGIPLFEYLGKNLPKGFKRANLQPQKIDFSKVKSVKILEEA